MFKWEDDRSLPLFFPTSSCSNALFPPAFTPLRLIRQAVEINIEKGKDRNSKSFKLLGLAGPSKKGKQTKRRQCEETWADKRFGKLEEE